MSKPIEIVIPALTILMDAEEKIKIVVLRIIPTGENPKGNIMNIAAFCGSLLVIIVFFGILLYFVNRKK